MEIHITYVQKKICRKTSVGIANKFDRLLLSSQDKTISLECI